MAGQAITTVQVSGAAQKLSAMRGSLTSWLRLRAKNDTLGIQPAARATNEQNLADELHTLLAELMPDTMLPNADLRSNPSGAVQLAQLAITGQSPVMQGNPSTMGNASAYLTWPVLIVGGLLLAIVTAIKTYGDVAKDAEEKACIRAGACTDYGFWLKMGGIAAIGYVAYQHGAGDVLKRLFKKGRS